MKKTNIIDSNKQAKAEALKAYRKMVAEQKRAEEALFADVLKYLDEEGVALPAKAIAHAFNDSVSVQQVAGNLIQKRDSRYTAIHSRGNDLVIEYKADRYMLLDENDKPTGVIKEMNGRNYYRTKH